MWFGPAEPRGNVIPAATIERSLNDLNESRMIRDNENEDWIQCRFNGSTARSMAESSLAPLCRADRFRLRLAQILRDCLSGRLELLLSGDPSS